MKIARPRFKPGDVVVSLQGKIGDDLFVEIIQPIRYEINQKKRWEWFYEAKMKDGTILQVGERKVYVIQSKRKKGKK